MSLKRGAISLLIGGLLIGLWLLLVDIKTILGLFAKMDIKWAIALPLLFGLCSWMRILRWKTILSLVKPIGLQKVTMIYLFGGFVNHLIPIRAGEIVKAGLLKRLDKIPISKSLPTIMVEKWAEFFMLTLLLLIFFFFGLSRNRNLINLLIFVIPLFILFSIFFFLAINKKVLVVRLSKAAFLWLPSDNFRYKVFSFIDSFGEGMEVVKGRADRIGLTLLLALLVIAADGLFWLCAFNIFDYQLSYLTGVFGAILRIFSSLLPSPPGNIGTEEMVLFLVFSVICKVNKNIVGAVALVTHLLNSFLTLLSGGLAMSMVGFKIKDVFKERQLDASYHKEPDA